MDTSKYELVQFSDKTTNRTVTKFGYKVGDWFVIVFNSRQKFWRIYRLYDGLTALKTTFKEVGDAIRCAEWLIEKYEPFFFIWKEYPYINLWRLTHLTVDNGELYMNVLEAMDEQRDVKWDEVKRVLDET